MVAAVATVTRRPLTPRPGEAIAAESGRMEATAGLTFPVPTQPRTMTDILSVDVEHYVDHAGIAKQTADQYRRAVRFFGEFLARPATRPDLTETSVNAWLSDLSTKRSPTTVKNNQRGITPVWNWLAGQQLVPAYNYRRMRRIRIAPKPVTAWSVDNIRALLAGAADLPGRLNHGPAASLYMQSLILVGYETGLRPSDVRSLRWCQVRGDTIELVQSKTKIAHAVMLTPETSELVTRLRVFGGDLIFPLAKSTQAGWESKLWAASERHGFRRRKGMALGSLRKSHATEIAMVSDLATAAASLGHVTGTRIARLHYVESHAVHRPHDPRPIADALRNRDRDHPAGKGDEQRSRRRRTSE